jgi:hypothetical protein
VELLRNSTNNRYKDKISGKKVAKNRQKKNPDGVAPSGSYRQTKNQSVLIDGYRHCWQVLLLELVAQVLHL